MQRKKGAKTIKKTVRERGNIGMGKQETKQKIMKRYCCQSNRKHINGKLNDWKSIFIPFICTFYWWVEQRTRKNKEGRTGRVSYGNQLKKKHKYIN